MEEDDLSIGWLSILKHQTYHHFKQTINTLDLTMDPLISTYSHIISSIHYHHLSQTVSRFFLFGLLWPISALKINIDSSSELMEHSINNEQADIKNQFAYSTRPKTRQNVHLSIDTLNPFIPLSGPRTVFRISCLQIIATQRSGSTFRLKIQYHSQYSVLSLIVEMNRNQSGLG